MNCRVRACGLAISLTAVILFLSIMQSNSRCVGQTIAANLPKDLQTPDSFPRFPAVEPEGVAESFQLQDGFQLQLIAADNLVTDPVAMTMDADGRAYVVEMNDYPYTDAKSHKAWTDNTSDRPLGRVRLLVDRNQDGLFDSSTVFADQLSWPSGIICSQGGVYVTATPDVWFLKDTDGDGQADIRRQVFTGFRKYNVQAVMNNPIWGLDNRIYVAGSSNGGSVVQPGTTQSKPIIARGDFRFDPRSEHLELQAGGARFGNAFDDYGNRFLCNIRNPAIHVVMDSRYVARNPLYAAPPLAINIAESGDQMPIYRVSPVEPWRELRGRQWSIDPTKAKTPRSELTGGGVFTSTSGLTVYRGDAYPESYRGQFFLGEVANNVIYRQQVQPDGVTFIASRADTNVEFVASTDTWFRPVNFYNAPDGTLYVLDMYREVIEHPWSIPDDIHARLDLTSGKDRGRIYRLAPPKFNYRPTPKLSEASDEQLVELLSHRNAWHRETAQRLLVERQSVASAPALRKLIVDSPDQPLAAIHAMWTLEGIKSLRFEDVSVGLDHPSEHVREQAVKLAEQHVGDYPQLRERLLAMDDDPALRVRWQLALTLGNLDDPRTAVSLAKLIRRDADNSWMQTAIFTAPQHSVAIAIDLLKDSDLPKGSSEHSLAQAAVEEKLCELIAASGQPESIRQVASSLHKDDALNESALIGLASGAKRKGISLIGLLGANHAAVIKLERLFEKQSQIARDENANEELRLRAISRLGLLDYSKSSAGLLSLIGPPHSQAIQQTAIRTLGSYRETGLASLLIARLPQLTPLVQTEALNQLLARPERTLELLKAIQEQKLPSAWIGLTQRTALMQSTNAEIKRLANEIYNQVSASRAEVIAKYAKLSSVEDNPEASRARGQQVYAKHCAACHRAGSQGFEIGPHLETVKAWDRNKLLLNILDPNREVAPQSMAYTLLMQDSSVLTGMVSDETDTSLMLKRSGQPNQMILRNDIESLRNTGLSLMPSGMEEVITPEAMSDLITYLQSQ